MNVVFAGTPEFAARALAAVLAAGHRVPLVLCQPDRPAGRGLRLVACPVKERALDAGLELFQPETLKDPAAIERLRAADADAMVVAAYGLLLPRAALEAARGGALNIHASLLPRWRGAAPIQRALLAGDTRTGITIMRMDEGLDTGPMLLREAIPIAPDEDAGSLHDRLAGLGARLIVEALAGPLQAGEPQPSEGVCYARKIAREDARIDWAQPAVVLERIVRAMRPSPGAHAELQGESLKIWRAGLAPGEGAPGAILSADPSGIVVACGEGALRLLQVQRPGGRRLDIPEFLRGARLAVPSRPGG